MFISGNKKERISILFLGTQITVGGAQRVLLSQAKWFYDKGYQVATAFFYDKDNLKEAWKSEYPFPVIDLNGRRQGAGPVINLYFLIRGIFRLWRLIRSNKFDLIETFTPDSNLLGLSVAKLAGVHVRIGSYHGTIEGIPNWRMRLHGWIVNHGFAHCLVVVSEHVHQIAVEFENIRPDRMVVIPNGIDTTPFMDPNPEILSQLRKELGIKSDDFVYLSVGRVTQQKGYTYLLEAIPAVLTRFPECTVFIIAGEGYLREDLERKARNLGIDYGVHFLGTRSDIPELLTLSGVFVMPSLSEGLPLALLEAMCARLPIVASRVGGIESVIKHGENGYLLPPADAKTLSSALIEIREDDTARKRFSQNNRNLILKEYTIDKMCSQYENLFLRLHQQERPV
jgi:glycosyltransferase involved in cell wall biosynthesis